MLPLTCVTVFSLQSVAELWPWVSLPKWRHWKATWPSCLAPTPSRQRPPAPWSSGTLWVFLPSQSVLPGRQSEFLQFFFCLTTPSTPQPQNTHTHIQQEESGNRKRVAFRSESGEQQNDADTPLSGRVSIDENFALNIVSVQPLDELVYFCQVTAGIAGVGDASTMLKVFCE